MYIKNLFNKDLKKTKILILTIISTVFFSYLLIRMNNYNLRTCIVIVLAILFINLTLNIFFDKHEYKLQTKSKRIGIFLSLIISLFIVTFFNEFFIYNYQETSVDINKNYTSIEEIDCIESIIINNVKYSKMNNGYYNTFDYDKNIKTNFIFENEKTVITFEKLRDIKIEFNKNQNLVINDNDKEIKDNDENFIFEVTSNKYLSYNSILLFIISICILSYYSYLLYSILINKKSSKELKTLIYLSISIILIGIYYYLTLQSNILFNDSLSYINYDFKSFLHLVFSGRTPIYPLIIFILKILFQTDFMKFICITQYILWFISLIYLYKTLYLITNQNKLSFFATILYSLSPAVVSWNNVVLTESIALSGTLIFVYYIVKYIKNNKITDGIIASILALILTFHRPTSIIYVVFLLIFFTARLIFEKKERKKDSKCLLTSIVSIFIIIIYAIIFHRTFGIFSISDAMPRQDLYVSMKEGFYKNSDDLLFKKRVEEALNYSDNMWNNMLEVKKYYSLKEINELTSTARKNSMNEYINYIVDLILNYSEVKFEHYSFNTINKNVFWINAQMKSSYSIITFGHSYILIIIYTILFILSWIKNKKVPYLYAGLFAFPLVIILSSFIGTCNEFMRTAICALPFTFISLVLLISLITKEKNYKNSF